MCDCIERTDALLADRNTRLVVFLSLAGKPTRPMIATEVREKKRGAGCVTLMPTFCPFCGERYEEAGAELATLEAIQ